MATEKCPKCGSYNTGTAYLNYVGKGVRVIGKFALSMAVGMLSGAAHGSHAGHSMLDEEEKRKVKGHVCYKCGHEW